jgi:UDP-glucose 4-epimerase
LKLKRMKNILLTGGAGYIGSHTAVVLAKVGYNVVIMDNFCNSDPSVLKRLKKILGKELTFIHGDVRNTSLVAQVLQKHQIEAVIHFAGLKAVGESVEKPIEYYANNVQGTISLLEAMQMNQVKTLVFSSSATVYGIPKYLPIDEEHPLSATNAYGRSKLHIEEILKDVARADEGWKIACLRYFNPVGAHESSLIGEDPYGIPNNLVPYISQVAIGKLKELAVYGNDYPTPDGTGLRDYIHVMDLAEGHMAALDYLRNMQIGWECINLGTGRGYSVLEVIDLFEKASDRKVPFRFSERRPGDIAACYASAKKAKKLLNWEAMRTIDDMCSSGWAWQKSKEDKL